MSEQNHLRPTFHQLYEELKPVAANWEQFGRYLGFKPDDLKVIAKDEPGVDQSFSAICDEWLKRNPSGTWEDIMKALEKMERFDLKIKLQKKFIQYHSSIDTSYVGNEHCPSRMELISKSSLIPCQSSSLGSIEKTETTHVDVPKNLKKDVVFFVAQFTSILALVQSALKQKLTNNQLNLEALGRFISYLLSIPYKPLRVTEGSDEIDCLFSPLYDRLSFLNTDPFHSIDMKYLNRKFETKIDKYDDDIDEFMKSTTIIAFKEMIQNKGLDKDIPVILVLSQHWEGRTLDHLHHLIKYLFKDRSSLLIFSEIHHSVLTIKYTIPRSLLLFLITMASRKVRGMKWGGVLSVQIGTILMKFNDNNESDIETLWALQKAATITDERIADDIQLLVNIGCDVNMKDNHGRTPLSLAACGNVLTLRVLLQAKANPNIQLINGITALHISSELGHHQCVDLLLKSKADPAIQTDHGATALHMASQNGHLQCVNLLLQSKAKPDIQDNYGFTALLAACYQGHHQCVDLLLHFKADPDIQDKDGNTALLFSIQAQHYRCVQRLFQSNADPNIQAKNGGTALYMASQNGNDQFVNLLLQSKADPDIQDNGGYTPLNIASENGHHQCVRLLLQSKASPNIQAKNGVTALFMASQNGHCQCVNLLLQSKADPDIQDNDGFTALHVASENGHHQCVDQLLKSKAHPNIQENSGVTALYSASQNGHHQCVDLLLHSNADPNIQDTFGATALHIASVRGHIQCVNLLLQSKADPDIQDNDGFTALYAASQNGHYQCADLLLKSKADPDIQNNKGATPLSMAICRKHHQIVKLLLKHKANPNLGQQYCPLLVACAVGDLSIVSLLLHYGALVDVPGVNLPLLVAVVNDHYDITKSLINAGAKVNVRNEYGGTPLMIASAYGNIPMVQLLLQSGADVELQDNNGCTAYDAAVAKGHQSIVVLLAFKLHERAQKYLLDSDDQSDTVASPQNDDVLQSSDTSPQINNDSSEAVSQQYQISNEHGHSDHLAKDQKIENNEQTFYQLLSKENYVNNMLSSLQSSCKSLTKNIEPMLEKQPRIEERVH